MCCILDDGSNPHCLNGDGEYCRLMTIEEAFDELENYVVSYKQFLPVLLHMKMCAFLTIFTFLSRSCCVSSFQDASDPDLTRTSNDETKPRTTEDNDEMKPRTTEDNDEMKPWTTTEDNDEMKPWTTTEDNDEMKPRTTEDNDEMKPRTTTSKDETVDDDEQRRKRGRRREKSIIV
jgi:hypothetical protein